MTTPAVGVSVIPLTHELDEIRALLRIADEGGLDLVAIQDHPYQRHFFDTWSLIPTLMPETTRTGSSPMSPACQLHPAVAPNPRARFRSSPV
jgi:alkanesulfonate monooxygenase SsuD/methylene tetrahydromethanopterin reductase-like flavin-dependent oxidoreductase (luciferase family)